MNTFLTSIKYDYLQRTRSYGFLITLCIALAIGYSFIPEPNAGYATIRIGAYIGAYNSAWIGHVTAIMTSIFLSLVGFYLINNSISNDQKTKMGQLVAATPVRNFQYLLAKVLSNFLVLLTIAFLVFIMSIILFFSYNAGFDFELLQFIKPYLFISLPALFCISVLAIVFELLFGRFSILQNVAFFFVFMFLLIIKPKTDSQLALDVFGTHIITQQMEETVSQITGEKELPMLSIGFVFNTETDNIPFNFKGARFSNFFLLSRIAWMLLGIGIIGLIAPFFHRFNTKERKLKKRKQTAFTTAKGTETIELNTLASPSSNTGLLALLKAEMKLILRKGKTWLWALNFLGMVALAFLPLDLAYQFALPILWFLQVGRLSDLTSKELMHQVHYFAFTSFKPLGRLLTSQLVVASLLLIGLALPLLIRLALSGQFIGVLAVVLGALFVVMLAALLGMLTKGKKLFELLFFMLTYTNINGIVYTDYFGAFAHHDLYLIRLSILVIILAISSFMVRKLQLKK